MTAALPEGRLLSWYGDDFTGAAAVMEVLAFGGVETVMFLDTPTPEQLARFASCRAIGIAGIARSQPPSWMDAHLPPIYDALDALGAPLTHYKICSTLDSSPSVGSIGRAADLAQGHWGGNWHPFLVAAPLMGRYQAFSQLFATAADGAIHRIDRHPVMSRHPVTPMEEADVRLHLARQTDLPIASIELPQLRGADPDTALDGLLGGGARIVALDCVDHDDLVTAGRLIWERRGEGMLAIGSQGVEYALLAYWRSIGAIPEPPRPQSAGRVERIVAVSGSVSPTTAAQIAWAGENGFALVGFDAASVFDPTALAAALENSVAAALAALETGRSVLVHTARGPDDPAIDRFRGALSGSPMSSQDANGAVGAALGALLERVLAATGLSRAVISGGDTSGHASLKLGIYALTALAPTIPGAALCAAHTRSGRRLELALKGGQMGTPDYFGWIRDGGGPR